MSFLMICVTAKIAELLFAYTVFISADICLH